jgi:hypothetical protein
MPTQLGFVKIVVLALGLVGFGALMGVRGAVGGTVPRGLLAALAFCWLVASLVGFAKLRR